MVEMEDLYGFLAFNFFFFYVGNKNLIIILPLSRVNNQNCNNVVNGNIVAHFYKTNLSLL